MRGTILSTELQMRETIFKDKSYFIIIVFRHRLPINPRLNPCISWDMASRNAKAVSESHKLKFT